MFSFSWWLFSGDELDVMNSLSWSNIFGQAIKISFGEDFSPEKLPDFAPDSMAISSAAAISHS